MNNRGQTLMLSILFAVFIFIFGVLILNIIKPDVTVAKLGLDCTNYSGISDGNKITCLLVDGVVPYFILLIISATGGIILERLLIW